MGATLLMMSQTAAIAPPAPFDEERAWIDRARAGDDEAIRLLVSRYQARVVRLAAHVLHRSADAEDVAQEAFVQAFRNLHRFRGESGFYTWLYRIVVRICLDRKRHAVWDAETAMSAMEDRCGQDGGLGAAEARIFVEKLMNELSPQLRAMLVLRELEGLEYEEIGRVLGIPVGRVKWRLNAARTRFRAIVENAMREVEHV